MALKTSSVTIKGLTAIQANSLAMFAENGNLFKALNEYMDQIDISEEKLKENQEVPNVDFDEGERSINHIVDYDC